MRAVFVVGHIADPVELVLDGPVSLDPGGQGCGWGIVAGGRGDQIHDLDGLLPGLGDGSS